MVAIYNQGDIVEVNLDPTVGHEPKKRRPVLVISADDFNIRSALTVVAPITTTNNGYPMHVFIEGEEAQGYACIEQMRAIDLEARSARLVGQANQEEMSDVLTRVGAVFGI